MDEHDSEIRVKFDLKKPKKEINPQFYSRGPYKNYPK